MKTKVNVVICCLLAVGLLPCLAASQRKSGISVSDAKRAVGEVAAQQEFPADYKLLKMGNVKVRGIYYHVFNTYLKERQVWRALVFANSGNYLGYYETTDEPIDLDGNGIMYPSSNYTEEGEEDEDGNIETIDISDANLIEFTIEGPPDSVILEEGTYTFTSSPKRIHPDDPAYRYLLVAERLVAAMNRRSYRRIRGEFSNQARERLSKEQAKKVFSDLRGKYGEVKHLDTPWLQPPDTAVFPATFKEGTYGLKIALDKKDEITGLWFLPYSIAFPEIGEHVTKLELPFNGRWLVLWGGDTKAANRHYGNRSQQYALEFVIADQYGNTHKDEGKKKEDYFAFGRPVHAPAAGIVTSVIQGVKDNKPGSPNPFSALGNAVMIQHSSNEVSVLSHLMQGSITVKVGDILTARQVIGRCGNSGDTVQPRIHLHLQDSPIIQSGSGYRLVFEKILQWKNGQAESLGKSMPIQGAYIERQPLPPPKRMPAGNSVEPEPISKGLSDVVKPFSDPKTLTGPTSLIDE
jgi:murein DD-endopeptidase MepM/ murein hydrolase activator NlpD